MVPASKSPLDRRRPIILVADDDQDTRELYRACFDTSGYRTAEAGTGSQAIVSAVEIVPDVLLTDLVLPDIDGLTIARRLKGDPRTSGMCILMVTGYANADLERQAALAGVHRVFLKPCLPQSVLREVGRALDRSPQRNLLRLGTSTEYGARELKRTVLRHITQPLAALVVPPSSCGRPARSLTPIR